MSGSEMTSYTLFLFIYFSVMEVRLSATTGPVVPRYFAWWISEELIRAGAVPL